MNKKSRKQAPANTMYKGFVRRGAVEYPRLSKRVPTSQKSRVNY